MAGIRCPCQIPKSIIRADLALSSSTISADRQLVPRIKESAWGSDADRNANPWIALDGAGFSVGAAVPVAKAQSVHETILANAGSSVAHRAHVKAVIKGSMN
jgi:hypothetical protein